MVCISNHDAASANRLKARCAARCMPERSLTCCSMNATAVKLANTESSNNTNKVMPGWSCAWARARVRLASNATASHHDKTRKVLAPTVQANKACEGVATGKGIDA